LIGYPLENKGIRRKAPAAGGSVNCTRLGASLKWRRGPIFASAAPNEAVLDEIGVFLHE
jgi:hypothetical protein